MLLLADTMRYRIDWKKRIIYIVAICIAYLAMSGNGQQRCYDLTGRTVPDSFRGLIIKDRQLCLAR